MNLCCLFPFHPVNINCRSFLTGGRCWWFVWFVLDNLNINQLRFKTVKLTFSIDALMTIVYTAFYISGNLVLFHQEKKMTFPERNYLIYSYDIYQIWYFYRKTVFPLFFFLPALYGSWTFSILIPEHK